MGVYVDVAVESWSLGGLGTISTSAYAGGLVAILWWLNGLWTGTHHSIGHSAIIVSSSASETLYVAGKHCLSRSCHAYTWMACIPIENWATHWYFTTASSISHRIFIAAVCNDSQYSENWILQSLSCYVSFTYKRFWDHAPLQTFASSTSIPW